MPFSESKWGFYFFLIFLRLLHLDVLLQVLLNKRYVCDGTALWPMVDVGGGSW